jgi:hypothetical protein
MEIADNFTDWADDIVRAVNEVNLFIIRGILFQIPKLFLRDTYSSRLE